MPDSITQPNPAPPAQSVQPTTPGVESGTGSTNPPSAPAASSAKTPPPGSVAQSSSGKKPFIRFSTLFIIGLVLAIIVMLFNIFFFRFNPTSLPALSKATPQTSPTTKTTPSSRPEWQILKSSDYGYSFEYPSEYQLQTKPKGTHLLESEELMSAGHKNSLFTVNVWDRPTVQLEKSTVEKWCFGTLADEALKEKMLCAFLSSAALDDAEIAGRNAYTVKYYNSDLEKVDFYIIPFESKIITIHAITLLNDQRQDTGVSKAKQILQTVKFTE